MKTSPDVSWAAPTRRDFLQGVVGLSAGALLHQVLPGARVAGAETRLKMGTIFVWLDGGMSQFESFDYKPKAPAEIKGDQGNGWPTGIVTKTRDAIFSSWFEQMAKRSDQFAVIRSMHTPNLRHETAYPDALIEEKKGNLTGRMAQGASNIPYALFDPLRKSAFSPERAFFAPETSLPFNWDEKAHEYVGYGALMKPDGHDERMLLLNALDQHPASGPVAMRWKEHRAKVHGLLHSSMKHTKADGESVKRYGSNAIGLGMLAARDAVASGLTKLAVLRSGHWDNHDAIPKDMADSARQLDQALAALLDDKGKVWDGLLVVRGEFGRTPIINKNAGRDHYPIHNAIVAHRDVRPGAFGVTSRDGIEIKEDPVSNEAFAATVVELATGKAENGVPVIEKLLDRRSPFAK